MATGAAAIMLHCVFEGSLSMTEIDKERRPYHKNCSFALHRPKDETPTTCFHHTRISYVKKPSWNNCALYPSLLNNTNMLQMYDSLTTHSTLCKKDNSQGITTLMTSFRFLGNYVRLKPGRAFKTKHKWAPERLQEYVIVFLKEAYQYCVKSSKSGDHTINTAAANALHTPEDETPTACFHNMRIHTGRNHHGTIIH
ncbi:hypothetical protein L1887_12038 [Cichorium endivia]|nr:hypothetical protein L1887_12038 [Cichorium endivia]